MLTKNKAADAFWAWFRQHSTRYAQLPHEDDDVIIQWMEILHAHLRPYSQYHLSIDLDWLVDEEGGSQLIVSARGVAEHFPTVEALVSRAPVIPGWQVVAFYPPQPDLRMIRQDLGDTGIDPYDLWFCPIELKHTPLNNKPFLTVYARVQTPVNAEYYQAVKAVLMNLLGERAATLELAGLRVLHYTGPSPCPGKQVFNLQVLPELLPQLDNICLVVTDQGELELGIWED